MNKLVDRMVHFFMRWIPDSFVIAIVLTLFTFALAISVGSFSPKETVISWGSGFWNLLKFTNQITLTLLLGYALANTQPIRNLLLKIAAMVKTPTAAYMIVCFITGMCALVSWGLSLITAGIIARAVGESCRRSGVVVHYPLLVASSFSGFVLWHQGLSSSIGLTLATPGHFLQSLTGVIPITETLFTPWNMLLAFFVLVTMPFVMASLHPQDGDVQEFPHKLPAEKEDTDDGASPAPDNITPAERLENSRLLSLAIIIIGLAYIWIHFVEEGLGLTLDIFNFSFLFAGLLLAGSPYRYIQIIIEGGRVASVFLLQYPFYAGIAAVMAGSGLVALLVEFFVQASNANTLPLYSFLSGGLLNLFIPSGGGQWAVQGPIMMAAAQELGANLPRVAMAVALGDQWTNLIQPLSIVPVIAIAQVPLRAVMGYCFIALFYSGLIFATALFFF
ncbi:MAG: TIGR00366 family protein [Pseudomonadales bacterium]